MQFDQRRRAFITLLGGAAAAWPLAARAQQSEKIWRVGVLEATTAERNATNLLSLKQALLDRGYVAGRNLAIEYRSADGRAEHFEELAAELVRLNVDVILARGTPAILAAKKASGTIPVVMTASAYPFTSVTSLARPGSNVTGLSSLSSDLFSKRVELIKETVPAVKRIGVMFDPTNPNVPHNVSEVEKAARSLRLELYKFDLRTPDDVPLAFEMATRLRADALIVGTETVTRANAAFITQLAAKHRLPAIYGAREFIETGGFMSYGVSYPDLYRRAAIYVNKIFKGAKPTELPVEQPTKFELIINLKAAKMLGLDIPPALLARADEVIE
jgi:ABC-type uncharacterized transport system substrate-binding protein